MWFYKLMSHAAHLVFTALHRVLCKLSFPRDFILSKDKSNNKLLLWTGVYCIRSLIRLIFIPPTSVVIQKQWQMHQVNHAVAVGNMFPHYESLWVILSQFHILYTILPKSRAGDSRYKHTFVNINVWIENPKSCSAQLTQEILCF